jgi:hypothetical protein
MGWGSAPSDRKIDAPGPFAASALSAHRGSTPSQIRTRSMTSHDLI